MNKEGDGLPSDLVGYMRTPEVVRERYDASLMSHACYY
jgi:hypothetical protein